MQKIILSLKKNWDKRYLVFWTTIPMSHCRWFGRNPAMFSATLRCQIGVEKNYSPAALGYAGINLWVFKTISTITTV